MTWTLFNVIIYKHVQYYCSRRTQVLSETQFIKFEFNA